MISAIVSRLSKCKNLLRERACSRRGTSHEPFFAGFEVVGYDAHYLIHSVYFGLYKVYFFAFEKKSFYTV